MMKTTPIELNTLGKAKEKMEKEIEGAIIMLVKCVQKNCRNSKPLILHSIRVGMKLLNLNQERTSVIAGFLHDLVEDTECTIHQIKKGFGVKIANLVSALTQEKIEDYQERWRALLAKIKDAGPEAMKIKIVDNDDNIVHLLPRIKQKQAVEETLWKYRFTIEFLMPYLSNFKFFEEHIENYRTAENKFTSCNKIIK